MAVQCPRDIGTPDDAQIGNCYSYWIDQLQSRIVRQQKHPSISCYRIHFCTMALSAVYDRILFRLDVSAETASVLQSSFGISAETPKHHRNSTETRPVLLLICNLFAFLALFLNYGFWPKLGVLAEISCFGHISVSGFLVT